MLKSKLAASQRGGARNQLYVKFIVEHQNCWLVTVLAYSIFYMCWLEYAFDLCSYFFYFFQMGGRSNLENELLCRFVFPERPGALMRFLDMLSPRWNISLFHYRAQVIVMIFKACRHHFIRMHMILFTFVVYTLAFHVYMHILYL